MRIFIKNVAILICISMLSLNVVHATELTTSKSYVLDFSEFDTMLEEVGGRYSSTQLADIPWSESAIENSFGVELENWIGDMVTTWDGENDTADFRINKNIGRNGAGLSMTSLNNSNTELWYIQENLEDGKTTIFSYDFKVTKRYDDGKTPNYFSVAGGTRANGAFVNKIGSEDIICVQNDETINAPFAEDTWYTVVVIATGRSIVNNLYNENGELLFSYTPNIEASQTTTKVRIARLDGYTNEGTEMVIDNIEKHVYYSLQTPPSLIKSNVKYTNVARNASFEFTFDQEISGDILIKDKDGETISDVNNVKTSKIAYNKLKVTFENDFLLDRDSSYTISFSEVVNSSSLPCNADDITFTTEDLHVWDDITVGAILQNGDNTDITFTLNDSYGYESFSGVINVARYENGVMKANSSVLLTDVNVGAELTRSFSLGTITDTSVFTIMQLDLTNGPVVMAIGEKQ